MYQQHMFVPESTVHKCWSALALSAPYFEHNTYCYFYIIGCAGIDNILSFHIASVLDNSNTSHILPREFNRKYQNLWARATRTLRAPGTLGAPPESSQISQSTGEIPGVLNVGRVVKPLSRVSRSFRVFRNSGESTARAI